MGQGRLPALWNRRVQAHSHHAPPESRRIYSVFGQKMPHARLSAIVFRNANPGAINSTAGLSRACGGGGKGFALLRSETCVDGPEPTSWPAASSAAPRPRLIPSYFFTLNASSAARAAAAMTSSLCLASFLACLV